jgi:tRNA nucleotidyltransferase (CCA-adding enzyme)
VYKVLNAIKRRVKRHPDVRNSLLFDWFSPLSLEMLLYLASRASNEQVRRFVSLYLTRLRSVVPLVGGDDLRILGLAPGPQFGRIRQRLLQARLDGEVLNREDEVAMVKSMMTQWN